MEVYALEIQLAAAKNDRKRQKLIYDRVNALNAAVSDPRVIGCVCLLALRAESTHV